MITKLDSACLNRTDEGLKLFATEFTGVTECFIKDELSFRGANFDTLKSIASKDDGESSNGLSENRGKHPVDCYITELLSRARASNKDSLEKDTTYHQFCSSTINAAVNSAKIAEVKCFDLVADTYWEQKKLLEFPEAFSVPNFL